MAEARLDHDWNQTASVMALIANTNRPRKSKAFSPADFHPLKQSTNAPRIDGHSNDAFALMKQLFTPPPESPPESPRNSPETPPEPKHADAQH